MASPPITAREYAYLKITGGSGNHSEISNALNIEPTNAWNKGDINKKTDRPRKFVSWQLESGLDDTHPIQEHIDSLFKVLKPLQNQILDISSKYDVCIQCVGYYHPCGHGIHFDKATINTVNSLGASFDLDFYYISDNGHDLDYV